jgi:hypothetical protein
MNIRTGIVVAFATALVLTPLAGFAQGRGGGGGNPPQGPAQVERGAQDLDRDRAKAADRTYQRDRDRDQDRTHAPDFGYMKNRDIYGNELMTNAERKAYRKQLATAGSSEERGRIEAEHRKEMQSRAEKKGVTITPPGKDIYGGGLMSVEERNAYREQLRLIGSDREERTRFMADHKEKMQIRAKAQGVVLEEETEEAE